MFLRIAVVTCLAAGSLAQSQCSKDHLDTCLLAVTLEIRSDVSLSTVDMMDHCRKVRENMNCIIWYTKNCLGKSTRHLTSEVIQNTRNYLLGFCEYFDRVDENWMDKECFVHHEMEDCKDNFLKQMTGLFQKIDQDTCSRFLLFRRCVDRVFNSRCKEKHNLYLPTYLFDKAWQLSWICTDEDSYYASVNERALRSSLKGAACLTRNQAQLSECRNSYQKEQETETSDSLASACCAFNEYSHCVLQLLPSECDFESREFTENGLRKTNVALDGMCDSYDFRSDQCSSTWRTLPYDNFIFVVTCLLSTCLSYDCRRVN